VAIKCARGRGAISPARCWTRATVGYMLVDAAYERTQLAPACLRDIPKSGASAHPATEAAGRGRQGPYFAGFFGDLRAASSAAAFSACFSARDLRGFGFLVSLASCASLVTFFSFACG
jgi:hypothetical protein